MRADRPLTVAAAPLPTPGDEPPAAGPSAAGEAQATGRARLARRPLLRLVVLAPPFFVLYALVQLGMGALAGAPAVPAGAVMQCGLFMLASGAAIGLYRRSIAATERRDAVELPWRPARALPAGAALGAALLCATQAIAVAAGASRIVAFNGLGQAAPALAAAFFAAVGEEIIFRGIVFRLIEAAGGTRLALVLSAVVFGGLHALNPGATLLGVIAIAIEAGVLLGVAFAATRSLWFPIGIHLGWNFVEGGVFGSAVSSTAARGMVSTVSLGSPLLDGGAFGLEASVQAVLLCLIAAPAIWLYARRPFSRSARR